MLRNIQPRSIVKQNRDLADGYPYLPMSYLHHKLALILPLYATVTAMGVMLAARPALPRMNRVEALEQMDTSEPSDPAELGILEPTESWSEPVRSIDQIQQIIDSAPPPSEPAEATVPDRHQEESVQEEALSAQPQVTIWNQNLFDRARTELTEEFYTLYRLVDQLARANQLDETSWQVNLVNDESPVPPQRANRIVIDGALFDQLHGDLHALACVVGREMAHHVQGHTLITAAERDRVLSNLQAEVVAEVERELGTIEQPDRRNSLGGTVLRGVGRLFGGIGTVVTSVADSLIDHHRSDQVAEQTAERQRQIEERYQSRVAEVEQQWAELVQQQTLTADRYGYEYATAAGFDPQGCIRAIQIMPSSVDSPDSDNSFQATRLEALQSLTSQHEQWQTQGRSNLEASNQALTYDSFGANQLRVHSRLQQQGIDQILGK